MSAGKSAHGILRDMTRAMVAAHRGVAAGAAENTIAAFSNAIDVGADMIEFDVRVYQGRRADRLP